jgi:hypothetical protein
MDITQIIDDYGVPRELGTIPQLPGFTSAMPVYADSGKPMFTLDQLRTMAVERDTLGSTKFDASFIKDQRSHGSCNGFAAAYALTKARIRRGLPRVDLSGAFAYSLMNGGRDNGSLLEDGMQAIMEHGIAPESLVKWDMIYPRQQPANAKAEALRYRAFECYAAPTELELFSGLAAGFDAVFAVDVNDSFMRLDRDGVAGGGRGVGNHAVSGDGYGVLPSGELFADGVNSWNTSYGAQGRMRLTYARHFANTTKYHMIYLVRSATDDPQGDNPPTIRS